MPAAPKAPQDRRPPARKQTAASKKRAQAVMDENFAMKIDGEEYVIVPADFTGRLDARVRRETGMSVVGIVDALDGGQVGVDLLAMFMWAVRIGRGEEDASLEQILDSVSYASEVEIVEGPVGVASPEA